MTGRCLSRMGVIAALILTGGLAVAPVHAQAWVAQKRQGWLSFAYQSTQVDEHLFSGDIGTGSSRSSEFGSISAHTAALALEYGLTDRLTVGGAVAYMTSSYDGLYPESGIDDGAYHGDMQDAVLGLRYNLVRGPLLVTPVVRVVLPTHNYETVGHTAVGTSLNEYHVGVNFAARFGRLLPDPYIQAGYTYAFVEDHVNHELDRDNAYFEVGCLFTERFSLRTFGLWQNTRDGVDWIDPTTTPEEGHAHDAAAAESFLHAGVGGTFALTPTLTLFASVSQTVSGENTHDAFAINIGTSWAFGAGGERRRASVGTPVIATLTHPGR